MQDDAASERSHSMTVAIGLVCQEDKRGTSGKGVSDEKKKTRNIRSMDGVE